MKKIGSILVLVVFLMTLIPTMSTFAAVDATRIYTEDFNNNWDPAGHYGSFASSTNSEIFYNGQGNGTFAAVQGYDGTENSALAFVNSGATHAAAYFNMKPYKTLGLSADTKLVFNMRFKPQGTPTTNFKLQFNHANDSYGFLDVFGRNDGKWYLVKNNNAGSSDVVWIDANEWYGLSVTLSTYEKDSKTYISTEVNVYDDEGNLIKTNTAKGDPELTDSRVMFVHATAGLVNGTSIVFDDAKLYCVTSSDTFNFVADGSTAADSKIGEDGLLTVKFDQPINPDKTDFTVSGATVDSVVVKDFNTAIVKVSGLSLGQSYTLNFSNVKSAAGTAITGTNTLAFKVPAKTHFTQGYVYGTDFSADVFSSSSEIFFEGKWSYNTYSQADGYLPGEKGIKVENTGDTPVVDQLTTKRLSSFGLTRDNVLIFTTRFKFSGESTENTYWNIYPVTSTAQMVRIGGGVDGKYFVDDEPIDADKWYNMSIAIRPDQRSTLMVNDSVTGKTIVYKSAKTLATSVVDNSYNFLWFQNSSLVKGSALTLADTDIYIVSKDDTITADAAASTAQNTTIAPDGTIAVQFDMPVFSHKVVGVEDGVATASKNNFTVEGADIGEIGVIDFNKVVVGFYNLDYLTDYVLDFEDIVYEGGAGLDSTSIKSISFTTCPDPNNELTLKGDAVCSGKNVTFSLYSKTGANPTIIVAFYNGETLEGAEVFENAKSIAAGATESITVTLENTHAGTTAKLFAWEGSTLKPLMVKEDITLN